MAKKISTYRAPHLNAKTKYGKLSIEEKRAHEKGKKAGHALDYNKKKNK